MAAWRLTATTTGRGQHIFEGILIGASHDIVLGVLHILFFFHPPVIDMSVAAASVSSVTICLSSVLFLNQQFPPYGSVRVRFELKTIALHPPLGVKFAQASMQSSIVAAPTTSIS